MYIAKYLKTAYDIGHEKVAGPEGSEQAASTEPLDTERPKMRPTEGARKTRMGEDSLQLEALIEANLKSTKMALISIVEPLVHTLETLVHEIQVKI